MKAIWKLKTRVDGLIKLTEKNIGILKTYQVKD